MRRFKTIMFAIFSAALVALFGFEVLAAVYLNISINTNIEYYSTEIGAEILGTYSYNEGGDTGTSSYLLFSGGEGHSSDYVYELTGEESSYTGINASVPSTVFTSVNDTMTFYVFVKNTGDRYIIPNMVVTPSDTTHIAVSTSMCFFDVSEGHIDPMTVKDESATATAFVSTIEDEIDDENCGVFTSNSSIDNNDIWCVKITISLQNVAGLGQGDLFVESAVNISIGFMADVQYTSNDVLSVYQVINRSTTNWTKFGYNATLHAAATKVETNSLSNLYTYLDDADEYGNANINRGVDDYQNAIVYRDIDLVNVDIATGEIIGKLSDINYDFEWYGRDITLPAGTTLASGRTLATSETFTVDVYTYYPTIYARRWIVGDKQWISISDSNFTGAVKIDEYYTATFTATIYNPDKTVSHNSYGIVTRSYDNDHLPLMKGTVNYMINNYGYGTYTGATANTTQAQVSTWMSNLTQAWRSSALYGGSYKCASLVQGENYTAFIYNLLYLVKYADNNSQSMVGQGNSKTYSPYNASGVTLISSNGTTITTGGNAGNSYYEAVKGGGTIGVYNANQKGTATYDSSNNYKMSASGFNNAGMNYGYNSTYTYTNPSYSANYNGDRQGLYTNQFLTYNTGTKRYLSDGYVGSDGYTSVFCLGQCDPWSNAYTFIFGVAIDHDGSNLHPFITFDDYDYNDANSWYMNSNSAGYEYSKNLLTPRGYVEIGYLLPTANGFYHYLGVSNLESGAPIEALIGLQPKDAGSGNVYSSGLSDIYYCANSTAFVYGVKKGGYTGIDTKCGLFCFCVSAALNSSTTETCFRTMLK